MRSALVPILVTVLLLNGTTSVFAQQQHFSKEVEYVKLTFDPHVALSSRIVNQLLHQPTVYGKAIRDVNGKARSSDLEQETQLLMDGVEINTGASFEPDSDAPTASGTIFGNVSVNLWKNTEHRDEAAWKDVRSEYEVLAKRFNEALRKQIQAALDEIAKREFAKHVDRQAELTEVEQKLAHEAQVRVKDKREALREVAAGLPQSVLEESVSNLQKQHQALKLESVGLNGRIEALQYQIKKATDELKKARPDDGVIRHLKKVLEVRAVQFQRLREANEKIPTAVSAAEIAKAEEQVSLAEAELEQAVRQAGKGIEERIERLNAELGNVAVANIENEAKEAYVQRRLNEAVKELRTEVNTAQPLREEIAVEAAIAQELAAEARKRAAELRRLKASYRPARVEVFDLKTSEEKPADADKNEKAEKR